MRVYRLTWLTHDGQRHAGAPRFLRPEDAERVGKLLRGDPAVQSVAVESVLVQPVALPVPGPGPVPRAVRQPWYPAA